MACCEDGQRDAAIERARLSVCDDCPDLVSLDWGVRACRLLRRACRGCANEKPDAVAFFTVLGNPQAVCPAGKW